MSSKHIERLASKLGCYHKMIRKRHGEPCPFQVRFVASGTPSFPYTVFVCGYHARGYTNVLPIQSWVETRQG